MILKYKYHSDSGLLEAYRSYTLAQNNSLSDTIVITSTASDAERYNYCLEFICYNSKSIPKAQYISPILNYSGEGISFTVPNNLTEFRGHVDMQLTGYDPIDNSIVFKSVSKNCKAFDVEGSLCVLEKDLNDTPNVFTEVMKQLEDLRHIHQDIIDEAMRQYGEVFLDKVKNIKWCKVKFYDNGKLLDEKMILAGEKLTAPQYTLPTHCVLAGSGWYNPASEELWNLEEDTVEGDTQLWLNYMTDDVVINDGEITSLGNHSGAHIYVPEYYDGQKVAACSASLWSYVPSESHIHFNNNLEDLDGFENMLVNSPMTGLYFPDNHPLFVSKDGYLYAYHNGACILFFAPREFNLQIEYGCTDINTYAIVQNTHLRSLVLPDTLLYLGEACIAYTDLEELTLPPNIRYLDDYAVCNNDKLKSIILQGDLSKIINDNSFVNLKNGNTTRPTLYVQPQHYANYKAQNLAYEIKALGQDYFDGKYAPKGE